MIKAIQIAICNRVDDMLNVHLLQDEFRTSMNTRICELHDKIKAALPDDAQELISKLDEMHTELETYSIHKVYQAGPVRWSADRREYHMNIIDGILSLTNIKGVVTNG